MQGLNLKYEQTVERYKKQQKEILTNTSGGQKMRSWWKHGKENYEKIYRKNMCQPTTDG